MTPEKAKELYFKALKAEYAKRTDMSKAIVQGECDLQAWQEVIAAITKEADDDWARKLILGPV